ncbi:uncharacterized protein [Procambarus clarkii]|uniref:uncharacterized protein n=1 Tax=Procambarus clarkii TaxID=6728 RepID=UPI001E6789F8|nr:uncharacterized protein LOC123759400 [Procambarus clarkii]
MDGDTSNTRSIMKSVDAVVIVVVLLVQSHICLCAVVKHPDFSTDRQNVASLLVDGVGTVVDFKPTLENEVTHKPGVQDVDKFTSGHLKPQLVNETIPQQGHIDGPFDGNATGHPNPPLNETTPHHAGSSNLSTEGVHSTANKIGVNVEFVGGKADNVSTPAPKFITSPGNLIYSMWGFIFGGVLLFFNLNDSFRGPIINGINSLFGHRGDRRRRRSAQEGLEFYVSSSFDMLVDTLDKMERFSNTE